MNHPESIDSLVDERLPFPYAEEVHVGNVICRDLLECSPDVPLHEAARRMSERRVGSILVVEGDAVLGIWTERDALAVDFDDPETFELAVGAVMNAPVRTVSEAVPLHGTPYEATLKLRIPDYAKADHAKRVDALFASWKERVEAVRIDAETGEFILHFKPLPATAEATGLRGWTLAELEQGLKGLPYVLSSEGLETAGAQ